MKIQWYNKQSYLETIYLINKIYIYVYIYRSNSHTENFEGIYLVQSDGNQTPIKIASDLPTIPNKVIIDLPWNLTPSNACKCVWVV